MRIKQIWILSLSAFLFTAVFSFGQETKSKAVTVKKTETLKIDKSNVKVQRHTVMSRFDTEIASSEEERMSKRQERIADTEQKLSILDTLDISNRKRKALLKDLKYTPYSTRLNKATVVTKYESEEETTENKDKLK
jgi:hypothetical protein